jgi:insulysin
MCSNKVYHNIIPQILPEGLERFARLFTINEVESTIAKGVIPREIGRVAAELDRTGDTSRAFYFLKRNVNPEHPFARFSAGSKTTLQTIPAEEGIDVASRLIDFFRDHYLSPKVTLVVVSREDLSSLDRWISPFSNVMSQKSSRAGKSLSSTAFPDPMIGKRGIPNNLVQAVILRSKDDIQVDENYQTLCLEWPLSMVYEHPPNSMERVITAHAVGFVLTQIICRRGPGSLRSLLEKLNWAPTIGSKGVPRISFPVDVSGFQILRMEICLTLDGFSNRSAVVSAVFESIRKVIEKPLQLDLIKQYLAAGFIHGYLLAPRPPDAITLAVDSIRFGIGGDGIGSNGFNWYLMPHPDDEESVLRMRQIVTETLETMSDDSGPLVSFRASPKAVFAFSGGIVDQRISTPPIFSPWKVEPVTGARYLIEGRAIGASSYFKSLAWFAATVDGVEFSTPYLNPLLPTKIRAPRPIIEIQGTIIRGSRASYFEDVFKNEPDSSSTLESDKLSERRSNWKLWLIQRGSIGLPMPVRPPEPTVECSFVVQLLSSLPSTFTSTQLVLANLWLLSFDDEVLDLAELGAVAGIAYETSMNSSGLRLSFRGVSQTLPSFVRRFCRRLVQHHVKLLDGSTKISEAVRQSAISDANRSPKINRLKKLQLSDTARQITEKDVASQGLFFLRCTNGGRLISQGDVVPSEAFELLAELQFVFREFGYAEGFSVEPELSELLYRPFWKPRDASPCLLPGISLISDACGRIPR